MVVFRVSPIVDIIEIRLGRAVPFLNYVMANIFNYIFNKITLIQPKTHALFLKHSAHAPQVKGNCIKISAKEQNIIDNSAAT